MRRLAVAFVATLLVIGTGAAVAAQAPGGTNRSAVTHQNGGVREHGNTNDSEKSQHQECVDEQDDDEDNDNDNDNNGNHNGNHNNQSEKSEHQDCVDEQDGDNNQSQVSHQQRGAEHQSEAHRSKRSEHHS